MLHTKGKEFEEWIPQFALRNNPSLGALSRAFPRLIITRTKIDLYFRDIQHKSKWDIDGFMINLHFR